MLNDIAKVTQSDSLYSQFNSILNCHSFSDILSNNNIIACACSGGPDSLALVVLLNQWCKDNDKNLVPLIVDHQLREESHQEAIYVKNELKKINLSAVILQEDKKLTQDIQGSVQAHARQLRYQLLGEYCQAHSIEALFVAHHLEDQAETYLLRLQRGSHVKGLACMQAVSRLTSLEEKSVYLLRPLLEIAPDELHGVLVDLPIVAVSDPSNDDIRFQRVKVRKLMDSLGEIGLTSVRLSQAASHMREVSDFIEHSALYYIRQMEFSDLGYVVADRGLWRESHGVLHYILLAEVWDYFGSGFPPRYRSLRLIVDDIVGGGDFGRRVLDSVMVTCDGDSVRFSRELSGVGGGVVLDGCGVYVWDGRFLVEVLCDLGDGYVVDCVLNLRSDLVDIFGDFVCDIVGDVRVTLPAIYCGGELCAVPLLDLYLRGHEHLRENIKIKLVKKTNGVWGEAPRKEPSARQARKGSIAPPR